MQNQRDALNSIRGYRRNQLSADNASARIYQHLDDLKGQVSLKKARI
jgi:hypothetical protein